MLHNTLENLSKLLSRIRQFQRRAALQKTVVKERLNLLSKPGERKTTIYIEDRISDTGELEGTRVTINIPQL